MYNQLSHSITMKIPLTIDQCSVIDWSHLPVLRPCTWLLLVLRSCTTLHSKHSLLLPQYSIILARCSLHSQCTVYSISVAPSTVYTISIALSTVYTISVAPSTVYAISVDQVPPNIILTQNSSFSPFLYSFLCILQSHWFPHQLHFDNSSSPHFLQFHIFSFLQLHIFSLIFNHYFLIFSLMKIG